MYFCVCQHCSKIRIIQIEKPRQTKAKNEISHVRKRERKREKKKKKKEKHQRVRTRKKRGSNANADSRVSIDTHVYSSIEFSLVLTLLGSNANADLNSIDEYT